MQIHQAIGLPLRPGIAPAPGLPRNDPGSPADRPASVDQGAHRPGAAPPDRPVPGPLGPANAESFFQALLARRDSDGDGQLAASEARAASEAGPIAEVLSALDSSGDGKVSASEYATAANTFDGAFAKDPPRADPAAPLPAGAAALRARADSDGNGRLSVAELSALLDGRLPRQDSPAPASTAENLLGLRAADQQAAPPPDRLVRELIKALAAEGLLDGG